MLAIRLDPGDPWVERRYLFLVLRLIDGQRDLWGPEPGLEYKVERLRCVLARRHRYLMRRP